MQKAKKGKLTLNTFFPISQYAAAVLIALSYPRLQENTWLLPQIYGCRAWLMLWVAVLLGVSILLDRAHLKAYYRDLWEIEHNVKNGNMNRSTLLALSVPLMLILDAVAVVHLYFSYFKGGENPLSDVLLIQHTAAMAIGMVLWIYGRLLPKIPYQSIWGIRTKSTMADKLAWGKAHLKAAPWTCGCGLVTLIAASLFSVQAGLIISIALCLIAFAGMFSAAK